VSNLCKNTADVSRGCGLQSDKILTDATIFTILVFCEMFTRIVVLYMHYSYKMHKIVFWEIFDTNINTWLLNF